VDNLTPEVRWVKEESLIKQVLCSTLPDTAFNRIKSMASVKAKAGAYKKCSDTKP